MPRRPEGVDTSVPNIARMYDYYLGGKDNFEADRVAAEKIREALPSMPISMRANRAFMVRVARFLADDRGIRQYLDIGTGLPTEPNLHQVVQQVAPSATVVYVDNDPLVLAHARALLTSSPEGTTSYLDADLRDVDAVLTEARRSLDFSQPIAVSLIAVMQHVLDEDEAHTIIARLTEPLAPGSTLALSIPTTDSAPDEASRAIQMYRSQGVPVEARTHAQVLALFAAAGGMQVQEPGVVLVHRWRPDAEAATYRMPHGRIEPITDAQVHMWGGVAVKRSSRDHDAVRDGVVGLRQTAAVGGRAGSLDERERAGGESALRSSSTVDSPFATGQRADGIGHRRVDSIDGRDWKWDIAITRGTGARSPFCGGGCAGRPR